MVFPPCDVDQDSTVQRHFDEICGRYCGFNADHQSDASSITHKLWV
jgi:hypothetical protein